MRKSWQFIIAIVVFCFIGESCKNSNKRKKNDPSDPSTYSKKNFTNFKLDSTSLISFLNTQNLPDSIKEEVSTFYQRREYQFAWFSENQLSNSAVNFYEQLKSYITDFGDSNLKSKEIDFLFSEAEADQKIFLSNKDKALKLELLLTSTFFNYAHRAYGGTVKNPLDLEWYIPRKKKDYLRLLDTIVSSDSNYFVHEPVNRYYILLKERLRQYRILEKNGGWPKISLTKKELAKGDADTALVKLKSFFSVTGDAKWRDSSNIFTDSLAAVIKRFQHRMGLTENGKLDAATLKEINVPVASRIRQMMINMERLRWVPTQVEPDFILINVPEFELHVFEQGKLAWNMNVVVGKAANQTTIFKGNISKMIINPYWVIPTSIIKNEILPSIKSKPSYLQDNDMELVSNDNKIIDPATVNWQLYKEGVPFTIRQKPGKKNALGKIKFMFPNSYSIYLHDSPAKALFDATKRTFSHGCIRVSNAEKLAKYILRDNPEWPEDKFTEAFNSDEQLEIQAKPAIPVYIVYFTTWVDSQGELNFRKDVYGLDEILAKEIFE